MRPFNDGQVAIFQQLLNECYSRTGKIDGGEEMMKDILMEVLCLHDVKSKKNFMFYDFRSPDLGIELKKHEKQDHDPLHYCGQYVALQFTRTIKNVPQDDADKAIAYIADHYEKARTEFQNDCAKTYMGVSLVGSGNRLVYTHVAIPPLDPETLTGKWETNSQGTHNLYVYDKETGRHVFTYWTNGNKLNIKVQMPSQEDVHVFDAQKVAHYPRLNTAEAEIIQLVRTIGVQEAQARLGIAA